MEQPLVSVAVITYNHCMYIRRAIDSILAQNTKFPFEVVVGEDCSTDGTREIVHRYQVAFPDKIRVVTSEANVGPKRNVLRTLRACRGKYLAYCEGDDYWQREDKLQIQVEFLERHPDCGLVCSDYDVLNAVTGERIRNFVRTCGHKVPSTRSIEDFLANRAGSDNSIIGGSIRTCTVMAPIDLVRQVKEADPVLHQSERFIMGDTQLFAEINVRCPIMFIPESLATYNRIPESATKSRNRAKRISFFINGSDMYLYLCDKYGVSSAVREWHEMQRLRRCLWLAFYERNVLLADEVRSSRGLHTLRERLLYLGAKHWSIQISYRLAAYLRRMFWHSQEDWV